MAWDITYVLPLTHGIVEVARPDAPGAPTMLRVRVNCGHQALTPGQAKSLAMGILEALEGTEESDG